MGEDDVTPDVSEADLARAFAVRDAILQRRADPDATWPDEQVADREFFVVTSAQLDGGQRVQPPDGHPVILYESPFQAPAFWPARVYRVGRVEGLSRYSFAAAASMDRGRCRACWVMEEMSVNAVLGPGGDEAVAIYERALRLSPDEIVAIGQARLVERQALKSVPALGVRGWTLAWAIHEHLVSTAAEIDLSSGERVRTTDAEDEYGVGRAYLADAAWQAASEAIKDAISAPVQVSPDPTVIDRRTAAWHSVVEG